MEAQNEKEAMDLEFEQHGLASVANEEASSDDDDSESNDGIAEGSSRAQVKEL